MIKAIYFVKRKPGIDVEAFQKYWITTHADLVKKVPDLRKYIQCHTLLSGYRKGQPVYDGVAEMWFDDIDSMRNIATTAESKAAQADDYNFIDMPMKFILSNEIVQKEGATNPSMVKLVEFLFRQPGMDFQRFQSHWGKIHGPIAAKIPQMRRYVQSHVLPYAYREGRQPAYDGVAEVWFDSTDAMRLSEKTAEYAATRADEPNFLDASTFKFIITKEHTIIG
ncbi:MAG: EthD family reductase [Candidatus Binataceae bacterium]|jgi:uncharacterized protein (TIGR02118 family)